MFNDANYFYSNNIYRHNTGKYQEFYGTKYDHFVDLILPSNPGGISKTSSVQYSSLASLSDGTPLPITFDRLIAYNSSQSTGLQNLNLYEAFGSSTNSVSLVRQIDNKWKLNHLRDYATPGLPIWTTNQDDKLAVTPYWIDRVPANIDFTKFLFETPRLSDYYTGVKLFFNPSQDAQIVTDLILTTNMNKSR